MFEAYTFDQIYQNDMNGPTWSLQQAVNFEKKGIDYIISFNHTSNLPLVLYDAPSPSLHSTCQRAPWHRDETQRRLIVNHLLCHLLNPNSWQNSKELQGAKEGSLVLKNHITSVTSTIDGES